MDHTTTEQTRKLKARFLNSVTLARSALTLRRSLWLTAKPAVYPITAARRMKSATISTKRMPLSTRPDHAGALSAYCGYPEG